jgi:hypothetical protein
MPSAQKLMILMLPPRYLRTYDNRRQFPMAVHWFFSGASQALLSTVSPW